MKTIFGCCLLLCWFILFTLSLTLIQPVFANDAFQESRDYRVMTKLDGHPDNRHNINNRRVNKIIVTEFFSYGCPACFTLEPYLTQWLKHQPPNVIFRRIPVLFEPGWDVYAKTYLMLAEAKLEPIFTPLIFNAVSLHHQALNNIKLMRIFLTQNDSSLSKNMINRYYDSPNLKKALIENEKTIRDAMIFQVPAFMVNQQYVVDLSFSGGNMPRLLNTVDYLIKLISQSIRLK